MNSFHLKIIALISMTLDHLGAIFFEQIAIFKIVGRVAFILYAFMLVEGYFHTKSINKYLGRLFLWAFISEIPYDLAINGKLIDWQSQNIFWTLFLCIVGIHWLENNKELGLKIFIGLVILFFALIFRVDYSIYGVSVIFTFYFCKKARIRPIIPIILLSIISMIVFKFQYFAFLGVIPILMYNGKQGIKTGNIYYSFYAVHLLIFAFIKYLIVLNSY